MEAYSNAPAPAPASATGGVGDAAPPAVPGALPPGSYREFRYAVAATAQSFDTAPEQSARMRALLSEALCSVLAHTQRQERPQSAEDAEGAPPEEPPPAELAEALARAARPASDAQGDGRPLLRAALALVEGAELGAPWMTLEGAAPLLLPAHEASDKGECAPFEKLKGGRALRAGCVPAARSEAYFVAPQGGRALCVQLPSTLPRRDEDAQLRFEVKPAPSGSVRMRLQPQALRWEAQLPQTRDPVSGALVTQDPGFGSELNLGKVQLPELAALLRQPCRQAHGDWTGFHTREGFWETPKSAGFEMPRAHGKIAAAFLSKLSLHALANAQALRAPGAAPPMAPTPKKPKVPKDLDANFLDDAPMEDAGEEDEEQDEEQDEEAQEPGSEPEDPCEPTTPMGGWADQLMVEAPRMVRRKGAVLLQVPLHRCFCRCICQTHYPCSEFNVCKGIASEARSPPSPSEPSEVILELRCCGGAIEAGRCAECRATPAVAEASSLQLFPFCRENVRAVLRCAHGADKRSCTVTQHALVLSALEKTEAAEIIASCSRLYHGTRHLLLELAAREAQQEHGWAGLLPLQGDPAATALAAELRARFQQEAAKLQHCFRQREMAVRSRGDAARQRAAAAPAHHSTLTEAARQIEEFDERTSLRETGEALAQLAARRMAAGELSVRVLRARGAPAGPTAQLTAYPNGVSVGHDVRPDRLQFWSSKINKTTNVPYRAAQTQGLQKLRGVLARLFPWDPTDALTPEERSAAVQASAAKARGRAGRAGRGKARGGRARGGGSWGL